MKNLFCSILLMIAINYQSKTQTFQNLIGGVTWNSFGRSVVLDTIDGGFTIAGFTNAFGAGVGVYQIHLDATGNTVWSKQFGNNAYGHSIRQCFDGGYIIAAQKLSGGAFHYYAIRTDNNGDTLWTKTWYNGSFPGAASDYPRCVWQTADNGFVFTGCVDAINTFCLIRTDANGNILWTKSYGINGERSHCVQQTIDGGFIICGYTFNIGAGDYDVYLIKTDNSGNIVWTKTYGTTGVEEGYAVQQTNDGGYIITGKTQPGGILTPAFVLLIKTNSTGDTLWTKTYGGTVGEMGYAVQQTADSGYIVTGVTYSFGAGGEDVYLIRTDVNGDTLWTKAYGGSGDEFGFSVKQTSDEGFIVVGESSGSFGTAGVYVYAIRTDANGNSGCNQSGTNTKIDNPSFLVSSGGSILSSGTTVHYDAVNTLPPPPKDYFLCISVNLQDENELLNDLSVNPNPFSFFTTIYINSKFKLQNANCKIYNVTGEEVQNINNINTNEIKINRENLPNGMYFYKISNDSEIIGTGKILIQ